MLKTETLKKTEKIASAAYLITGFFDDKEPLKWKLRMLSSKLVSASVSIKDNVLAREENVVSQIQKNLLEMSSLFTIAKNAGLVSEMNHSILSGEISKLAGSLAEVEAPALNEEFFFVPKNIEAPRPVNIKDKSSVELVPRAADVREAREYLPTFKAVDKAPKTQEHPHRDSNLREFGAVAVKKNSRQSVIINLLKRKKEIMIKDVSPLIDGVSEKTIQRELLSMVGQGILRKEGEKRWSRYSLA
jgi:hypothetical protein